MTDTRVQVALIEHLVSQRVLVARLSEDGKDPERKLLIRKLRADHLLKDSQFATDCLCYLREHSWGSDSHLDNFSSWYDKVYGEYLQNAP